MIIFREAGLCLLRCQTTGCCTELGKDLVFRHCMEGSFGLVILLLHGCRHVVAPTFPSFVLIPGCIIIPTFLFNMKGDIKQATDIFIRYYGCF